MEKLILKAQKQQLHDLIKQRGLEPCNFKWGEVRSDFERNTIVSRINYLGTDYFLNLILKSINIIIYILLEKIGL